jgi:hypothetical protein
MNPGDIIEGSGELLQQGRWVANVDYHLTIPGEMYMIINPTGGFARDYESLLGGFIMVPLANAAAIGLNEYVLELADKRKKTIQVERRYKQVKRKGENWVSFWVKVVK